jgi:glycosyltransferase involved in cell wall biosynthesis
MKISVVTASLNAAATIRFTLDSFLTQDYPQKELLLVDGGSTDDTVAIARSYAADEIAVVAEPDHGLYEAMNKGLDRYCWDAVGFLNADDRFAGRDCMSAIASALRQADIVYGDLDFVADHETRRVVRRWRSSAYAPGAFRRGWMPAHPTFYIRREVAESVGKFDLRFKLAADYDYMLRAMELRAFRTAFVDRVLVEMQRGGRSTRSVGAYLRSNLESHRSRMAHLGVSALDLSILAKPGRKLTQMFVDRPL